MGNRWGRVVVLGLLVAGWGPTSVAEPPVLPTIERRLPPKGIDIPLQRRDRLTRALEDLERRLVAVRSRPDSSKQDTSRPDANRLEAWLPDVEVFVKAVDLALRHGEFYQPVDLDRAEQLLETAAQRLDQLRAGKPAWTQQRGLVVRGYRSRLDGSVQPYGLVIARDIETNGSKCPLYVWLHGRGETQTDLNFVWQRMTTTGTIAPAGAIVLHPFGRYCNAFKWAGEVDVFEAIEAVRRNYPIDPDRIVLWGFSMGGAGTWHLAAHHPDVWVAASPGAGFAETRRYQGGGLPASQQAAGAPRPEDAPWFEQMLWGAYDVPDCARNLFLLPLVAYSGENDGQIQAARVMEEAFTAHGKTLHHIIGPGMGHRYHPDSLTALTGLMQAAVQKGRDPHPARITFQTRTLRYHRAFWVEVLGLDRHWVDSRVDSHVVDGGRLAVQTRNISGLRLRDPRVEGFSWRNGAVAEIDGQELTTTSGTSDGEEHADFQKVDGRWRTGWGPFPAGSLRKAHGLQGPIDDFMFEPFLFVEPSGRSSHPRVDRWVQFELGHQRERWRLLFRGEVRIKRDVEVSDQDIATCHLVLWGDPSSNRLIARLADRLPIRWTERAISAGNQEWGAAGHVLAMIHPNLLQDGLPSRMVVLNSGPTFREAHDRSNSLQTPKLPDWAVIDLSEPPGPQQAGRIAAAGFFDESWQWQPSGQ